MVRSSFPYRFPGVDSLQLRVDGFLLFFDLFVVRPSLPRILPVCYAALCLLLIYVCLLIEKKKKKNDLFFLPFSLR